MTDVRHLGEVAGIVGTPVAAVGFALAQITPVASSDVSLSVAELAIVGGLLGSVVAALVFVHRLLISTLVQSQAEKDRVRDTFHEETLRLKDETIDALNGRLEDYRLNWQNTYNRVETLADKVHALTNIVQAVSGKTELLAKRKEEEHG